MYGVFVSPTTLRMTSLSVVLLAESTFLVTAAENM
eukprot:jgi/Antlo1/352/2136